MYTNFLTRQGAHTFIAYAPDDGGGDGGQGAGGNGGGGQGGDGGGQQQHDPVPYDRFQAVNQAKTAAETARAEAEQRAQAAQDKLTELERQGLGDVDRLKAELADAQTARDTAIAERDAATGKVTELERGGWVRQAATDANFHDPEDAIARVDLSKIESQDVATREVAQLAERAKHLIQAEPDPSGGDLLRRVLDNGKTPTSENGDEKAVIPTAKLNEMSGDELVQLQEKDPELYQRSLAAASAAA